MNNLRTKFSFLTAAAVSLSLLTGFFQDTFDMISNPVCADAAVTQCTTYSGSNVDSQNYSAWSDTIKSYLTNTDDGLLMRVQSDADSTGYLIEYYDAEYNLQKSVTIDKELPIFGGFYSNGTNYYILSGQTNSDESEDTECFRITKYDSNWNRIGSAGLYDCNTVIPFDVSSARFAEYGKYLLIRTGHEMYATVDGYNHQANVTIQLDTEAMEITDSYTGVMNTSYGYVSHSFNQFIQIEDNNIVAVDHGDTYPRSIVLIKYVTDISDGTFSPDYYTKCSTLNVLSFAGNVGQNTTGASVGGFEISDSSYLVAYNSVIQDDSALSRSTRNIYIGSVDKSTSVVTIKQITNYDEGDGTTSTPHLVRLSDGSFLLLWSRDNDVYYTKLDSYGNNGTIYSIKDAALSDCVPIEANGKLIWYTWKNETITFYDINLSDISENSSTSIENGHSYIYEYPADGSNICKITCGNCDYSDEITVPTSYSVWWNENSGSGYYYSYYSNPKNIDDEIYYMLEDESSAENTEFEVISSKPDVAEISSTGSTRGHITFLKAGSVKITVRPKYNPTLSRTYTFYVDHEAAAHSDGNSDGICDECGEFTDGTSARLAGYTLSLEGNIGVNFHVELSNSIAYDKDAYMQFTLDGEHIGRIMISDAAESTIDGKKYYVFKCEVPAKNMTSEITAQIFSGETACGNVYSYTVREYADYILNNKSDYSQETIDLVEAMLTYGGYAQTYFGFNTDKMANEGIASDLGLAVISDKEQVEFTGSLPDGITYYGTSLILKSNTIIRHYFKAESEPENYTGSSEGLYYYDIAGISADKLASKENLSIGDWSVSASPMSYAYAVVNGGSDNESLINLVKAMYLYYEAATAYKQ